MNNNEIVVLAKSGLSRNQRRKLNLEKRVLAEVNGQNLQGQRQGSSQTTTLASVVLPGQKKKKRKARKSRGRGGNSNGYLRSLIDPENTPGSKVPDLCTFPTGTFQLTSDLILTTGATADGLGVVLTPNVGDVTGTSLGPFWTGVNSAIGGALTWTHQNWQDRIAIQAAYQYIRPVSACITAEYVGSTLNDSGQFCVGIISRKLLSTGYTASLSNYASAILLPFSKTCSLRERAKVTWKPMDNHDLEFRPSIESASADVDYNPAIFIVAGGMTGGMPVKFRVVVNFEGIPLADTSTLVQPSPSPVNLGQLSDAMTWAGQPFSNIFISPAVYAPAIMTSALMGASTYGLNRYRNRNYRQNAYLPDF